MKSSRNSNIELLRIVGLFLIVLGHFAWQTNWNFNHTGIVLEVMVRSLWIGGKLGVNLFVLISGYFLIKSKFKAKSFIRTWLMAYFYAVVVYVFSLVSGINHFDLKQLLKSVFFVQFGYLNWFVTAYLIMYLLIPFINVLLKRLTHKQFLTLLSVLLLLSINRTLFHNLSIGTNGNDAMWLIIVYCFGAYIRVYETRLKSLKPKFYYFSTLFWLFLAIASVFLITVFQKLKVFPNEKRLYGWFIDGFSPIQLLLAVSIFVSILYIKPYNRQFINKIASTTFAIYLIHANLLIVDWLWNSLIRGFQYQQSYFVIIYGLLVSIAVFVICSGIDIVRQQLFKNAEKLLVNHMAQWKFWKFLEEFDK